MPKLSLYRSTKQNDYNFLDRSISEHIEIGGTDLYIHKYLGPKDQGPSVDETQPKYDRLDPSNIQDLLFLENRDRAYDKDIYRLRGHYNVQNLDFDLSQFGLFMNNDIIFINVHYNTMIDLIGRKLMNGDVIELPHLMDYHPLDDSLPVALKRFYQITDASYSSEGFSATWYPHMWRIKCEPLINSQEFADILNDPIDKDNYLGDWNSTKTYPPGYTVGFGDKIYESIIDVPTGIFPPNEQYWKEVENGTLADIMSTYNKNIAINDAVLREAARILPKAGYDTSKLYVVPTYGTYTANGVLSDRTNEPAPPLNIITSSAGAPVTPIVGTVVMLRNPQYKYPSAGISISPDSLAHLQGLTDLEDKIDKFIQSTLSIMEEAPEISESGSGSLETTKILAVHALGPVSGPYSTADNTYATADQNPLQPDFTGDITSEMNYRSDSDPRFQYIARSSPKTFGYATGYLSGDGTAPNGYPAGSGIAFPQNPQVNDYFLRIDYAPQILFRWDGTIWVRISANVRTPTGYMSADGNESQLAGFINNDAETYVNNLDRLVPESQALSSMFKITPDNNP